MLLNFVLQKEEASRLVITNRNFTQGLGGTDSGRGRASLAQIWRNNELRKRSIMTQLNFKLVVLPPDEPDVDLLRQCVERCGVVLLSIDRIELAEEILECMYEVRAEDQSTISNRKKFPVYRDLYHRWHAVTAEMAAGQRPLLQPHLDECFPGQRFRNQPRVALEGVSFGTMARFGEFLEYASIREEDQHACFSHDVKELDVCLKVGDLVSRHFQVPYRSLRNIFVSLSETSFDLYLDVLTCPLFYEKTQLNNVETKVRSLPLGIERTLAGKSNIIHLRFASPRGALSIVKSLRNRSNKIPVNFVAVTPRHKTPPATPRVLLPHFGCSYMFAAVANRSFAFAEQSADIRRDLDKLLQRCAESPLALEAALADLVFVVDSGRLVNYWRVLDSLYRSRLAAGPQADLAVPRKCRLIRRATVTPTRVLFWPPDLMTENRVLRNFDSDFVLRVTFRDDNFARLNGPLYDDKVFREAVVNPMNAGISVGGRRYEMLAWSSSQLKEHGASMYARDTLNRTAADIRRWTEINPRTEMNIPKCLARIGQCFSQTEDTVHVPLDDLRVRFEDDIEGGFDPVTRTPYTFSDGVGKISTDLAERVCGSLRRADTCSAFQIRYGGCKGMLVVDPSLQHADIVIRRSMKKFDCRGAGHSKLEIANRSRPIAMRLNRPFIAILHDLKIEPRVFLRLQEDMLQSLTDMLLDEEKAAQYLHTRTPFSLYKFQELNGSGISLTMEPFFRNLLLALHRYYIDLIKSKANIDLDPDRARNMFGVLDETGTLEYGQVFVQYSRDCFLGVSTPDDAVVLTGTVMVTKFPCVHPGDVRKFEAVDVPQLRHIVDCIVFPQKGPRPHPDEMAGSDLDGDEFAVIWMPELIFEEENNTSAHYPKPVGDEFRNITDFLTTSKTEDVTDFLVHYIKNDQIGAIASAHLAIADDFGIKDGRALHLAAKHAVAVDFSKTGCAERLDTSEQPKQFPDFMERMWKRKYKSKKSLGKMYRVSKDFESENRTSYLQYTNVQLDEALVVEGWEEFEESASASRNAYNSTIKAVLQTYGIEHEAEAFGGAFLKLHSRFQDRRDRREIVTLVHSWLQELLDKTRSEFFAHPPRGSVDEVTSALRRKASAWYVVTYRETGGCEFLSFPWVVSDILAGIRLLRRHSVPPLLFPVTLETRLEEAILRAADLPPLLPEAEHLLRRRAHGDDAVARAVRVLSKWALEERITTIERQVGKKKLFYNTFVKLILHVVGAADAASTSAAICLSFFKFCVRLRFASQAETEALLPFKVYNLRFLTRMAIVAFHGIAVSGSFHALADPARRAEEVMDMRPVTVHAAVFGRYPLDPSVLERAEDAFLRHSEAEWVSLREVTQRKKVVVAARGTAFALKRLKEVLKKDKTQMDIFLITGEDL